MYKDEEIAMRAAMQIFTDTLKVNHIDWNKITVKLGGANTGLKYVIDSDNPRLTEEEVKKLKRERQLDYLQKCGGL